MISMPLTEIISNAFILLGLTVMTIGVIGIFRMPDVYTKLHAASKSVFLGVFSLLIAVSFSGNPEFIARAALIGILTAMFQLYASVSYGPYMALLIASLLTPWFDKWLRPKPLV